MENKISLDVAEAEFYRFGEMMDLDFDKSNMDDEDKVAFETAKRTLITALQRGSLVINDNGEPVFTPQRSGDMEPLTFHEPTGATYISMDRKKQSHDMGRFYAVMGDMCKTAPAVLSKLKGSDNKVCQAVVGLFLA